MIDLNKEKLLFYDVEVFKYQSCVVFKNFEGETVRIFTDNLNGLGEYIDNGVLTHKGYERCEDHEGLGEFIEGKVLVGYNNYHYDDYILYAMTNSKLNKPAIIKEWNDSIIKKGEKTNMKPVSQTIDVFQQIDVSMPGLKKIEGNLGKSIIESAIDFNIDRELTAKENLETIQYCEYDVLQTIEVFKLRKDYFETKKTIIDMMDSDDMKQRAVRWNTTSIVGHLLASRKRTPIKNRRYVDDSKFELVPLEVADMWLQLDKTTDYKFKIRKTIVNEMDNVIEFGWGGLHGAPNGVFEAKNVKLLDVTSMYPSILINFNGLGEKTKLYQNIKSERVKIKESGENPELNKAYKLILNSTYGLLNNQYSRLNNPMLAFSICIYGQISLYVLSQMLYSTGCRVFNINTDGVAFLPDINNNYKNIVAEWEKQFGLELEEDDFTYWIQKDVNNYIAVAENGFVKTKGGDTNNYRDFEDGGRNYYFNNSNARIVQKALVDKLIYNTAISDTVYKNRHNYILYQYILQAGRTYMGTYDNDGNKLQNVNRVFAGNKTGYEIFKKRLDGGLVKYPDAPTDMIVFNGDLSSFSEPIDLQWYAHIANKVYERWRT